VIGMETISGLELLLVLLSLGLLGAYHAHLSYKVRLRPLETSIGITDHLRRRWAQTIMQERRDVLAVQTLRNWIMASSFLASTAMLISLGIINTALKPSGFSVISHALNVFGTRSETLWLIKMLLLVIVFFFTFFNFTLAIRYFNHASFGLGIPDQSDGIANHDFMTHIINSGSFHYTLGMRGYYLSIPFGLWIFGPVWMLGGTVVLLLVLYKLDRTA
jgi:uncharacterized membrane protein